MSFTHSRRSNMHQFSLFCRSFSKENSTQMYYSKLTIDRNALKSAIQILQNFTSNNTVRTDHVEVTTSKDMFGFSPLPLLFSLHADTP